MWPTFCDFFLLAAVLTGRLSVWSFGQHMHECVIYTGTLSLFSDSLQWPRNMCANCVDVVLAGCEFHINHCALLRPPTLCKKMGY